MRYLKIILFFILTQTLFSGRLEVNADLIEAEGKEIHFIGNAKLKMDDSWLHAHRVNVYLDENNETKMYEAEGFVKFLFKDEKFYFKGSANEVIYDMSSYQYILRGKALIEDNDFLIKRNISGDEISLNLFTGRVKVDGAPISTNIIIKLHNFGRIFGL